MPFDFIFQICWTIFPRYGPNEDHMDIFLCLFSVRKSGGHDESLVKSVHVRSEIIVVLYTQEIRGNLFLHCPKLPSPFLIKSTNIWMIMLARIFNILSNYRRRTLESFVYSTIRGGWYEGTEKINVNCRSPSRKKIKLPLNGDLTLWNSAVIYLFPIAVNLKSILFHLEGGN